MKFLDEYRDGRVTQHLAEEIRWAVTKPWTVMEVCGGQTHTIVKFGIDQLLPPEITLVHGPGCPVCVTPRQTLDRAMELASLPEVIFCSFGDMLRVPGSHQTLQSIKAAGGDVRIVYSPLDAVKLAREHPRREVVFFAVGFETTAPANAMAAIQARRLGLANFSLLVSQVLVAPAMEAVLRAPDCRVEGFLAAGHVCTVMGMDQYPPLSRKYHVPVVVTGFEPVDILHGLLLCIRQLESGRPEVENQYQRVVRDAGNPSARQLIKEVFQVTDRQWRGLGEIAQSGLTLTAAYADLDAERRFQLSSKPVPEPEENRCGLVLQGRLKPEACPAFGTRCTPNHPLGAPMVSAEGTCSAYFRYRKQP